MNYFEDHIGDYAAATLHLTWDEDMAYTRLIRAYYHTEKPIPKDQVYRLARAATPAHRKAVDAVLKDFFTLDGDDYRQKRCDHEIARFKDKQEKAKRSADARWNASKPHSEGNANGMRTHSEGNAPQSPVSSNQSPIVNTEPNGSRQTATPLPPCPTQEVVDLYHQILPDLPRVQLMSDKRKRVVASFWKFVLTSKKIDGTARASDKTEAMDWTAEFFNRASQNDWLMGRGTKAGPHENWRCDLDFLMSEKGKIHVIEKTAA